MGGGAVVGACISYLGGGVGAGAVVGACISYLGGGVGGGPVVGACISYLGGGVGGGAVVGASMPASTSQTRPRRVSQLKSTHCQSRVWSVAAQFSTPDHACTHI